MEPGLKQRLVGAAALAALAVVFLPMVFDDTGVSEDASGGPWIPPRPPELSGPQFAPLTEAEIKRGARLPPPESPSTPDDPGSTGETSGPAKPPATDTTAPAAAPPATSAPGAETRALAAPAARPATGLAGAETARTRKDPPARNRVGTTWAIQLGSFSSEANAKKLRDRLQKLGFQPFVEHITVKTGSVFRVRVGPERERHQAEALRAKIRKQANLDGVLVRYP